MKWNFDKVTFRIENSPLKLMFGQGYTNYLIYVESKLWKTLIMHVKCSGIDLKDIKVE